MLLVENPWSTLVFLYDSLSLLSPISFSVLSLLSAAKQNMIAYQKENNVKAAAVIGGGLLGLEAAKAMYDLGMETHIIEYAPILMCRQVGAITYYHLLYII